MFREGQKVWSPDYGWGEVYEIFRTGDLQVMVDFGGITMAFAHDGSATVRSVRPTVRSVRPTLFHDEPKDWPNPPPPLPDIAVDTPVWVQYDFSVKWDKRHFAGWENGRMQVWLNGKTSHTTSAFETVLNWSLTKPSEKGSGIYDTKEH